MMKSRGIFARSVTGIYIELSIDLDKSQHQYDNKYLDE